MRIIWLEEAERDLDRIVEYIAEDVTTQPFGIIIAMKVAFTDCPGTG